MTKYLINRILRALLSVVLVIAVIMVMIYAFLDRESIFASDPAYQKQLLNNKTTYKMQQWERYGYVDYIPFADFLAEEVKAGNITEEQSKAAKLGATAEKDDEATKALVEAFYEKYDNKDGYKVERLAGNLKKGSQKNYKEGGKPALYAHRDVPLIQRLITYFTSLIKIDNIHNAETVEGERGISFTLFDPAYGGKKFSPAIMGNGTTYKYLLYCNDTFPYIHQNLIRINLGVSYSVNKGVDVFRTMTDARDEKGQLLPDAVRLTKFGKLLRSTSLDELPDGKYTFGKEYEGFRHSGDSDYMFYDKWGTPGRWIDMGQNYVQKSKLVIDVKRISDNIYEIEFAGAVDYDGNTVNGRYKGAVDFFRPR